MSSSQKQSHKKGKNACSELGRKSSVFLSDFWPFGIRLSTLFSCVWCGNLSQLLQDFFIVTGETWTFLEASDLTLQHSLSGERTGLNKGFQDILPTNSVCTEAVAFSQLVLLHLTQQTTASLFLETHAPHTTLTSAAAPCRSNATNINLSLSLDPS